MRRFQIAGAAVATAAILMSASSAAAAAPIIPVPTLPIPILLVCQGSLATIVGTDASQVINGTPGNDVIVARGGNDVINGLGGNDKICAGNGNDVMRSSWGSDRYSGDAGNDTLDFTPILWPVTANLTTVTAVGHGLDAIATTENLIGSNRPDTLVGNAANNVIQGRAGTDRMWGLGGHDLLLGGAQNDRYDGGTGIDTASFAASPAPVSANLTTGSAFGEGSDALVPGTVENLVGTRFNDLLVGNAPATRSVA